jgi:hypothetical protein
VSIGREAGTDAVAQSPPISFAIPIVAYQIAQHGQGTVNMPAVKIMKLVMD